MVALPGSPLPAPIQTFAFLLAPETTSNLMRRLYGDVYTSRNMIFGEEIIISDPALVKQIFTGDPAVFHAGEANASLGVLVGDRSVLLLDGEEHLRHRRLVMPPFHGERMQAYAETMRAFTDRAIEAWRPGEAFALHPTMQRITLDIILRTVFGVDGDRYDTLRELLAALFNRIQSPLGLLMMAPALQKDLGPLTPWAAFKRQLAQVDGLIYAQIAERRAELAAPSPRPRGDVLTLLLTAKDEDGQGLGDKDLRDELMTLLAAGHETTATALCWAFEQILRRPAILARLRAELDAVVGARAIRAEDLPKLEYLDATIKEVMRLRPPIPVVARRLKAPVKLGDYELPAGALVVPSAWHTHHRADLYPEPTEFRPERFLGKKTDPYAYFPFGGGVRRCVGMAFALYEMKIVLATVLRRASLRLESPRPLRVALRSFVFAPEGGTRVVLEAPLRRDTAEAQREEKVGTARAASAESN